MTVADDDDDDGGAAGPVRRRWGRWSLRARLTALTSLLLCAALVAGAVLLTGVLQRGRLTALDDVVSARSRTVAELAQADRLPEALPVSEPGEVVQLLDATGHVIATSPSASRTLPLLPAAALAALRPDDAAAAGDASGPVRLASTHASAYDSTARVAVRATTYRGEPAIVVASMPLGEVEGLLGALRVALVGVVPVLTALFALTIWLALGRALRPVDQLRRAAAEVARSGGPGSLPEPRTDDELGALARTLNEMLDRLEHSAARQRTFVADAAHELRSPLAALRASIDVAQAHPTAYRTDELAGELSGEVLRMQALVDDLLLLARVGSAPSVRAPVDLAVIAHDAVAEARAASVRTAPDQGAAGRADRADAVDVQVTGSGVAVGDAPTLARVVRNLVENAVRHAAGHVVVAVADGSVTVDDDGGGVPETDRERVFERFVRLDDARQREAGGSGLGLAIVREIARDQQGDVMLGVSPAGGLRAVVRLPTSEDRAPRQN